MTGRRKPRPPTLRQLERWHRDLDRAHTLAFKVASDAERRLGESEPDTVILLNDPLIELHVALGVVESMIEEQSK